MPDLQDLRPCTSLRRNLVARTTVRDWPILMTATSGRSSTRSACGRSVIKFHRTAESAPAEEPARSSLQPWSQNSPTPRCPECEWPQSWPTFGATTDAHNQSWLVARYADACNIFDSPELAHKLDVLREHCTREGRDYTQIEKTAQTRFDLGERGEKVNQTIEHLHELAELGIQVAHGTLVGAGSLHPLELMAEQVIPAVAKF